MPTVVHGTQVGRGYYPAHKGRGGNKVNRRAALTLSCLMLLTVIGTVGPASAREYSIYEWWTGQAGRFNKASIAWRMAGWVMR